MCGIIGYTGPRDCAPILLAGLRQLEYRGYDSAGVAILGDQAGAHIVRAQGKLHNLAEQLEVQPVSGHCGIGHTRWATHGKPSQENAHPHRRGKVSVVHNGIIENHLELREKLEAAGHTFSSETDTEIFAHLIDAAFEANRQDIHGSVRDALADVRGTWALCVLHDDHPQEIVVARHGSPLLIGLGGTGPENDARENFVASDVSAMLEHTRQVVDLEDGDSALITPTDLAVIDGAGQPVQRPSRHVDWSPVAAEKQGYKHFMLKEIHDQPTAISDTLMGRISLERGDVDLDGIVLPLEQLGRITILACGTSWHAGLAGKYMIEQLARIPVEVDLASEYRYRDPIVNAGDLVIAISQSGETADTLAAMREAQRLGANALALCNVVGSSIARAADHVLYTHAGPEISVASTKAFTTQLAMLAMLAVHMGRRTTRLDVAGARAVLEALSAAPELILQMTAYFPRLREVARRYMNARDFLYLGRGLGFPVALEGALKLKEISYVHAEGYASGEMKHGPIALVDENMPVVVVALQGPGYKKVISNLEEVRARGGKIIALATEGDERIGGLADEVIRVPDVHPVVQPIVASIPLQLLDYHMADLKGTDVDQPRNLAKSVTVE
jgi:glucosamine--fructose-6-phosphate aminotransferase (isomerizing)